MNGMFAKPPQEHQKGGCFYDLPAPPGYNPNDQLIELWKECNLGEVPESLLSRSEPIKAQSADAAPASLLRPSSRRPPTTPRTGRSLERPGTTSPATLSPKFQTPASSEPPVAPKDYLAVQKCMEILEESNAASSAKVKRFRSASGEREITKIVSLLSGDQQIRVDDFHGKTSVQLSISDFAYLSHASLSEQAKVVVATNLGK